MFYQIMLFIARKNQVHINKFLLTEEKFISELHLKQPGYTCKACG